MKGNNYPSSDVPSLSSGLISAVILRSEWGRLIEAAKPWGPSTLFWLSWRAHSVLAGPILHHFSCLHIVLSMGVFLALHPAPSQSSLVSSLKACKTGFYSGHQFNCKNTHEHSHRSYCYKVYSACQCCASSLPCPKQLSIPCGSVS